MPPYPHTKLFSDSRRTVVLSGPHIQVLDTQSGRILHSTANFAPDTDAPINSGPIRCSGMSRDGRYLATTGDDKRLKIWDLESLSILTARELPKKPTTIEFSSNTDILVSDKFGDVFRYALHPNNEPVEEQAAGDALSSHENPSSGELILGHASLLTSCLLTLDEKFIITADRDEHIRVSWYPEGYVIESYCLGHKKYVSAIHIPVVSPARLISGGGDLELKVWDWMTGRLQQNITIFPAVEPFIRVTVPNIRRELLGDDDEEPVKSRGRRTNAGKERRRNNASLEPEDSGSQQPLEGSNATSNIVFVVRRISSFLSGAENHVVFSVVGATAIFEFILAESHNQPDIRHYDFGKPVIDFTVCGEGTIWVLLDVRFLEESNAHNEHPHKLVQVAQWSTDKFIDAGSSMLLDSLNTICSLPAAAEDLQALDLYSDLSSLPKSIDGEQGGRVLERLKSSHEPQEDEPTEESASVSVGLTKRALGRLKHKRALDQLHHEKAGDCNISAPGAKKMKADSENELHSMQYEKQII
ncbi:WD40 repeat-like protein [Imleria badia]|nr:WD40 repeat-like protein [Imleria badia]